MKPTKKELRDLNRIDLLKIILHLLWLYARQPALPRPVHFAVVAALSMIVLMPLMPQNPLAIPIIIGGGIAFAIITSWR